MARFDDDLPFVGPAPSLSPAAASASAKPKGGARLLSFIIQALVMAVALALFFLFASVAALVLLHLCVVGRALRLRSRRRVFLGEDASPSGLSPADLRELPWFECSALPPWPPDCAVCLEGICQKERFRKLPSCGHVFHAACVDRWLVRSPVCPICRTGVEK
ncbi:RING-H2 finger protein ATL56-like [Typha latifolia]|uniref:RING-H2 finger protein ATL56-like n=1 Tax=Typha latifolia TaxID=4733 RepID=UPI003C2EE54D